MQRAGYHEAVLTGIHLGRYGIDLTPPTSLLDLLRRIQRSRVIDRLRLSSIEPLELSGDIIRLAADSRNTKNEICPHFHIPLQSGDDAVLKRMNRPYGSRTFRERVLDIRKTIPDAGVGTDVLVGFPGETEEDFQQTMELLERVRYHGSFSFKYSDRPETRAADLDGKLSEAEKGLRLQQFQKRQDEISLERNREYVGHLKSILVENNSEGKMMGRTVTNHIVHVEQAPDHIVPGSVVTAEIIHAGQHSLKGAIPQSRI